MHCQSTQVLAITTGTAVNVSSTVTPSGLVSISVTPANVFLTPGQTQQFVATGTFSGGSTQTLQSVIWTSSNASAAVVSNSPGSAGLVNALTAGTAVITATAGDPGGSSSFGVATLVSIAITPSMRRSADVKHKNWCATNVLRRPTEGATIVELCCLRLAVAQRVINLAAYPQPMQQHRQLSRHGHNRTLLCILPSSRRQLQPPPAQITIFSKRSQDVVRPLYHQRP